MMQFQTLQKERGQIDEERRSFEQGREAWRAECARKEAECQTRNRRKPKLTEEEKKHRLDDAFAKREEKARMLL